MITAVSSPVVPRLVAALALAAGLACWPAPALAAGPDLPGESIETSADPGAPVEVGAGTWSFTVGDSEESRFFRWRRTLDASTLHASVVAGWEQGEGLALTLTTPEGRPCGSASVATPSLWGTLMSGQTHAGADVDPDGAGADEDPCVTANSLVVEVGRSSTAEGTDDLPVTLRLVEEAPVASVSGLPSAEEEIEPRAPDVSGDAAEVEGAPGLVDVPEIEAGIHRGVVASGEMEAHRIALDWGQSLLVRLVSPKLSEKVAEGFEDGPPGVRLQVRSPLLAGLDSADASLTAYDATTLDVATAPVRYLSRGESGAQPIVPGDHVVVVEAEDVAGEALDVGYTLQVEVVGEPEGEPDHTEDEPFVLGDGERARTVAYGGGAGLLRTLSAAGLAVLGAASLGTGVVLLRRR